MVLPVWVLGESWTETLPAMVTKVSKVREALWPKLVKGFILSVLMVGTLGLIDVHAEAMEIY